MILYKILTYIKIYVMSFSVQFMVIPSPPSLLGHISPIRKNTTTKNKRHSSEAYFTPSRIGFCVDCVTQELPSRYITSSAPLDRLVRPRGVLDAVEKKISAEGSMLLMVQKSGESFPPGIYGKTRGK